MTERCAGSGQRPETANVCPVCGIDFAGPNRGVQVVFEHVTPYHRSPREPTDD